MADLLERGDGALRVPLSALAGDRFLIDIDNEITGYETVYADDVPDVMDLLARWLPAIQGAAVTALLGGMADNTRAPVHLVKSLFPSPSQST
ncbi:hypothetical protein [Streptomyces sp. NPDC093097]|uniref:hypothetical protein n=1 Tax=Streptomyces sp. NPDC093097 TaxID=3366027 RepID=UPI0037F1B818